MKKVLLVLQVFSWNPFQKFVKQSWRLLSCGCFKWNTKIAQTWRSGLKLDTITEPQTTQIKIKLKEPCVQAFREALCKVDSLSWLGWAPRIQAAPRDRIWGPWQVDCLDGNENFAGHLSTRHQGERSTWSTADTSSDFCCWLPRIAVYVYISHNLFAYKSVLVVPWLTRFLSGEEPQ